MTTAPLDPGTLRALIDEIDISTINYETCWCHVSDWLQAKLDAIPATEPPAQRIPPDLEQALAERTSERDALQHKIATSMASGCWCDETGKTCQGCQIQQESDEDSAELDKHMEYARKFWPTCHSVYEVFDRLAQERDALAAKLDEVDDWLKSPASFDEVGNLIVSDADRRKLVDILNDDPFTILAARLADERKVGAAAGAAICLRNSVRYEDRVAISYLVDQIEKGEVEV